jgi:hypothetical protein
MTLDSIITEWRFRLPHGYPTTSQDYNVLQDVLLELTNITESEAKNIVRKAMGVYDASIYENLYITEQSDDPNVQTNVSLDFKELGLPNDILSQINRTYLALSDAEKELFNKNYRVHTIESYVANGYKAFEKFFMVNVGGARGGMGNGEICVLLGVKDSKPGGTAQHDIVLPTGQWEVKELKDGRFDPAAEGLVSKYPLTEQIQTFYTNIVKPLTTIGDPYTKLKHLVNPSSHDDLKRLIMIFETRFSDAIDADKLQSYEWKKSALFNWYKGFQELNKIFYKSELDTDIRDTRLTVSSDGSEESYWIDDSDVNDIRSKAGTEDNAYIKIGSEVTDKNDNVIIWFKRIEQNEFIKNPNKFIDELNNIKSSFFNNIAGLIWYEYRNPVPHIGTPADFAVNLASQGRYRFVLKNIPANNGYDFIQQQS